MSTTIKYATMIECSPGKNIIYTVLLEEADLIWHMMSTYQSLHNKWPKIIEMIDYIRDNPTLFGNTLFKNIKIEEKKIKPMPRKTLDHIFVDYWSFYSRLVNSDTK